MKYISEEKRLLTNEIIERAGLQNYPIYKAIVENLIAVRAIDKEVLCTYVCDDIATLRGGYFGTHIIEESFAKLLRSCNDKLKIIDNTKPEKEILLAEIIFISIFNEGDPLINTEYVALVCN